MKENAKHIFLFFIGTFFLNASFAQTKDEQVKSIRKKFELINKDTTLKKVVLENEDFLEDVTDNGGKLVGYYKLGKIKKIYEWIGLSNGISIREFYFDNEQLIFAYETFNSFVFDDKKNEFDFTKTKTIFEGRYYFSHEKLFTKTTKGNKSEAAQESSTEQSLLERATENMSMLNKKIE